jgi:hypothetical protein
MTNKKIYILTHTPEEMKLEIGRKSEKFIVDEGTTVLKSSKLELPRWDHWSQRKLARLWYATLLGMNIEPTTNSRAILKANSQENYQTYRDRLDIGKALIGYELDFYEDHALEGNTAGEKYVSLEEYYTFAVGKGWTGLEGMREGLHMDTAPPVLGKRKENNHLELLYRIFLAQTPNFSAKTTTASAKAVIAWLKQIEARCPVSEQTLINWINEMKDLN